jgi:mannose/fructose-specific phosphotransferase system component IIA
MAGGIFSRITENIYKPKDWKLFAAIITGKMLGLAAVIAAMIILPGLISGTPANAADTYTAHETAVINSLNTVYTGSSIPCIWNASRFRNA